MTHRTETLYDTRTFETIRIREFTRDDGESAIHFMITSLPWKMAFALRDCPFAIIGGLVAGASSGILTVLVF